VHVADRRAGVDRTEPKGNLARVVLAHQASSSRSPAG
jgi:hypothetical protein